MAAKSPRLVPPPRLFRIGELAAYLAVSENTVRRMVERGELPGPIRLCDKTLRWDREAVDKLLDGLSGTDAPLYDDADAAIREMQGG